MLPLSQELRTKTAGAHERAEESRFVTELMDGASCSGAYAMLATQHLAIYRALEGVMHEHYTDDPIVGPFVDPALDRVAALESDLDALGRDPAVAAGKDHLHVLPATEAYVDVLLNGHSSEVILANHYVRYLGDLSGGQIVAAHIKRRYDLGPETLGFYHFDEIEHRNEYKDGYRARLDALELSAAQRTTLVEAAIESFLMNQKVFVDLDASQQHFHDLMVAGRG